MPKPITRYRCQNCGHQSTGWLGKCPSCEEWNTFEEEVVEREVKTVRPRHKGKTPKASTLAEISNEKTHRWTLPDPELHRVLGGGLVPGSLILLGGHPGIGKSTLLLQTAMNGNLKTLYVSGEESQQQIKMRAERLELKGNHCLIYNSTLVEDIVKVASAEQPQLLIIDSIQTLQTKELESTAGTISQIRDCTAILQDFAKGTSTAVLIIGHITKEGAIAGPKLLEHMVDTVLYFEGERNHIYRVLRTHKNRFGSTDELGIYEMTGGGLRIVENPSEILLSQSEEQLSGSAVAAMVEGQRPMLIEIQALVSTAIYGNPQRSATGFDLRRLSMLLAVLEKRCGYYFGKYDVFLNVAGGLRVVDTGNDLATCAALISSLLDMPLPRDYSFAGEVGLSGEIRPVQRIDRRVMEAAKLGFKSIFVPKLSIKALGKHNIPIEVVGIAKLTELKDLLFAGQ